MKNPEPSQRQTRIPVNKSEVIAWNRDDVPDYWEDIAIDCPGCGKNFVMTAQNQAHWHEVEKLPLYLRAVRCSECSKRKAKAESICRRYEPRGINGLSEDEMREWHDAIELLMRCKVKHNEVALLNLKKKLKHTTTASTATNGREEK